MSAPAVTLAAAINREHEAAVGAARSALEHAIRCGELLLEAKAAVGHGGWLPWIEANCTLRPRTAQAYMKLARAMPKLSVTDAQRVADLSVRDAIAQLAQQARDVARLPEPVAAAVLAEAEDARLGDRLVYATNQQRRPATQDDGAGWTTIELPPALPAPDRDLAERIAATIDASGLDPLVVQETLNRVYLAHQNRHRLMSPYGPPADPEPAAVLGALGGRRVSAPGKRGHAGLAR